jgi:hypothetical protein
MVMFDDAWPVTTVRFAAPATFSQVHAVIERFDHWLLRGGRFAVDVRLGNAFSQRAEAPVAQVMLGWARLRRGELMHRCGGIAWVSSPGRETSLRLRFYAEAADALMCPARVFTCRSHAASWLRTVIDDHACEPVMRSSP